MRIAAQPTLYDPTPEEPLLLANTCQQCDRFFYPPMTIGCEVCGADESELREVITPARGHVFAIADAFMAMNATPTPFTIADVVLDAGPLVRVMVHLEAGPLQIGDRVSARWRVVRTDTDGNEVVEPGFVPEAGEQ